MFRALLFVAVFLLAAASAAPAQQESSASDPVRNLVVIDAGHGGADPGARGPGGTREKDINLIVAHELAKILRQDPSLDVRMTRTRDTLIALRDRPGLANRWRTEEGEGRKALFISIHCNAHNSRSVQGFETFFLSTAKTEDERRVAAMENAAVRFEDEVEMDPFSFILNDLRQNEYLRESSDWAAMIQDRLAAMHPGPNRGVKQAGFAVLDGAFMPAVLVELGFLSNPEGERMLRSREYQRQFAQQLSRGVRDYFARSPAARLAEGQ